MKLIPLTQGQVAMVDDEDYEMLANRNWQAKYSKKSNCYYAISNIGIGGTLQEVIQMHRVILGAMPWQVVDHENHDTLDNRRLNLKLTTPKGNSMNMRLKASNTSGFCGVSWHKLTKKWMASIYANKRHVHLGLFANIEDAIAARKAANVEHGFHENHGKTKPKEPRNEDVKADGKNRRRSIRNKSGHCGVFWNRKLSKWQVSIYANKKTIHLGYYADKADAIAARQAANEKYGFHEKMRLASNGGIT